MAVKVKFPREKEIERIVMDAVKNRRDLALSLLPKNELDALGKAFVGRMKVAVLQGQSPITGQPSRFKGYKDTKKYPAKVQNKFPDKRARPVNLTLSGQFLKSLVSYGVTRGANKFLFVGFNNLLAELKELGHREGVNGQPSRPIIPEQGKEDFIAPLRRFLEDAFKVILRATLAKQK